MAAKTRSTLSYDDGDQVQVSDDMLLLGEEEAVASFFDEVNARRLRFMAVFLGVISLIYSVVSFTTQRPILGLVAGVLMVGNLALLRLRHNPTLLAHVRQVCAVLLLVFFAALQAFHGMQSEGPGLWLIVFAILAARLRLAIGESVALFAALYALYAVRLVIVSSLPPREGFPGGELVGLGVLVLVVFGVAIWLTHRQRRRFLLRWRAESLRHRDRLRMKQELEYAREIQLSMLPREAPNLAWLDIAALSLPANEVGGDYYDYFPLGSGRLCVVVGDVTGHGVASGLVLSGVRAGLNLLQEEMGAPEAILDRVNKMLVKTATPRMLMTLGVTVLDGSSRTAVVATAGHPPALALRADTADLVEVGRGALPLGARQDTEYAADRVQLEAGDLLLLYSDGLVETMSPAGEQYGWERLQERLAELGGRGAAKDVRDALLRDVWDFKGDAEQVDDVTMVVIRVVG